MISVDEILEIDLLVLKDHRRDGSPDIDIETHRSAVEASKTKSQFAVVRRQGRVAAYGYFWPLDRRMWFVGGIAIHPKHRNPSVFRELAASINDVLERNSIRALRSNVFKANTSSIGLHRRLGFAVTRKSDIGFEFTLENLRPFQRYGKRSERT